MGGNVRVSAISTNGVICHFTLSLFFISATLSYTLAQIERQRTSLIFRAVRGSFFYCPFVALSFIVAATLVWPVHAAGRRFQPAQEAMTIFRLVSQVLPIPLHHSPPSTTRLRSTNLPFLYSPRHDASRAHRFLGPQPGSRPRRFRAPCSPHPRLFPFPTRPVPDSPPPPLALLPPFQLAGTRACHYPERCFLGAPRRPEGGGGGPGDAGVLRRPP